METELEVRILNINKEELIKKLNNLNAKFIFDVIQTRYVYDFNPARKDSFIRLRTDGIKTTLTIKEYVDHTITGTKELEIEVSDLNKTDLLLEKLGYKKRGIQNNKRVRYLMNDVEIDIDTWPGLNTYVEFESSSEDKIKNVIKKLGYNYTDATTDDAYDIYMKEKKNKDINNLTFKEE